MGDIPITEEQTAMVIAYRNRKLIADSVFPSKKVFKPAFKWLERDFSGGFTVPSTLVGRKSKPNEVDYKVVEHSDSVEENALQTIVTAYDKENAEDKLPDLASERLQSLANLLLLGKEKRLADLINDPDSYDFKQTVAAADKWTAAASNPIAQLLAAIDLSPVRPSILILNQGSWSALRTNANAIKHVNGANGSIIVKEQLAMALELEEVLVGESYINLNKEGKGFSRAEVWRNNAILQYRDPTATVTEGCTYGINVQKDEIAITSFDDQSIGGHGSATVLKVAIQEKNIIAAKAAGVLLQGVI